MTRLFDGVELDGKSVMGLGTPLQPIVSELYRARPVRLLTQVMITQHHKG
jgi:hypothetical protein